MENFFNLRAEKQEHIIDASCTVFSRLGYKKTSTADIAAEAGITKSMVFYYFGNKKNLYIYLIRLCYKIVAEEIEKQLDKTVTDYFDKLIMVSNIKVAVMKKKPAIIKFLMSVYYETDTEVIDDIKKIVSDGEIMRKRIIFDGMDTSKFKDDVDPKLIEKFLRWAGEGWVNSMAEKVNIDNIDALVEEFYDCIAIMKKYLYKN